MRTLLLVLLVSLAAPAICPAQASEFPCIRFVQSGQRWILDQGIKESPTLAGLAHALCRTDVIAYVRVELTMRSGLSGTCSLIAAAPQNRYVLIRLNSRLASGIDRIATLSHELEHAVQIARAPWVRSPADVLALQKLLSPHAPHAISAERVEAATRQELTGPRAVRSRPKVTAPFPTGR